MDEEKVESENNQELEPQTEQEEKYLGRFTRGTWYGGIIGAAVGYLFIGLAGILNENFSLGIDKFLNDSTMRYLMIIIFVCICGKIGSVLEKKKK